MFFIVVFKELLTCFKALISRRKETPLSGRRADGTRFGGVMRHKLNSGFYRNFQIGLQLYVLAYTSEHFFDVWQVLPEL